ncbi:MAG: type II secretion system F family protein [Acidimicrobiales bacterium]
MNAVLAALLGALMGLGLYVIVRAVFRSRTAELATVSHNLAGRGVAISTAGQDPDPRTRQPLTGFQGLLGRAGVRILEAVGFTDVGRLNDKLRVLDRSVEQHAYEKLLAGGFGFILPIFAGFLLTVGGVGVSPVVLVLASLVLGAAGFFYPDLPLTERVEERRRQFRHALSSYLDLVTILMAGGAGTESALEGAAEDGEGWPFVEIRGSLRRASLTRTSPWEAFEELGIELGVSELQELAASVALAGAQGAKIKQSLVAKADAMRAAQSAEIETISEQQTEKMLVPLVVMAFGVSMFVGYGAIESITSSSDPDLEIEQPSIQLPGN